jgi:hypothetical protein
MYYNVRENEGESALARDIYKDESCAEHRTRRLLTLLTHLDSARRKISGSHR